MRIVYCIDRIDGFGGRERVTVIKANALAQVPGNEAYVVTAFQKGPSVNRLDKAVQVDLGVRYCDDVELNAWKRLLFLRRMRKEHRARMKEALEKISPDIVVATGMSEKRFLPDLQISSRPVFLLEMHFSKYYRRSLAPTWRRRLSARVKEFIDYRYALRKYDRIVVLTEEDKMQNWKGHPKVEVMPNPLAHPISSISSCTCKTAVTAGRVTIQKNFSSLVSAWKTVASKHPDWQLHIFGNGPLREELQRQIEREGLQGQVLLEPYSQNIMEEMANASIFVLSSLIEGLPLVMIEGVSCGLPVVSYACPTGPRDIIREGINGYLVPVNDEAGLAERICRLIEDESLRKRMGERSREMSGSYSLEHITARWMELFQKLLSQKYDR